MASFKSILDLKGFTKIVGTLLITFVLSSTSLMAQTGSSTDETIPTGSLIIAMDNNYQGNAGACSVAPPFNLKAYGLAAKLLNNNVPVKWVIANKATKDATDFTANTVRVTGPSDGGNCGSTSTAASRNFSGGPLVISAEYAALAMDEINEFNGEIANTANDVRVYQVTGTQVSTSAPNTDVENVPVRYTLNHKPQVAVGPVNGGWGGDPHTVLFTEAKLNPYFTPVADVDLGGNSCYTLATQAHATSASPTIFNAFKTFVTNGGNFLIQCESITHFEQNQSPRFMTLSGFNLFGNSSQFPAPGRPLGTTNTNMAYDFPAQPFNQFIGAFPGDVDGAVSEYSVVGTDANFINSGRTAVRNNNAGWNTTHVAAVSQLPTNTGGGGHVFTLGGHNYYRVNNVDIDPADATIERRNAQRMILNAVLIPSIRNGCSLAIPVVQGFKQVQTNFVAPGDDVAPAGPSVGDIATWTIRYVNTSLVPVPNFQIVDNLNSLAPTGAGTYVSHSLVSVTNGPGGPNTAAVINPNYNGTTDTNLLLSGYLDVGGRIEIRVRTLMPVFRTYLNHPTAFGTGLPGSGVKTDTVDSTTLGNIGSTAYPKNSCATPAGSPCFSQTNWQGPGLDPTGIFLLQPSAAPVSIEGRVIIAGGRGMSGTNLYLANLRTGVTLIARTNTFGYFRFESVDSGDLYTLTPFNKKYEFPSGGFTFTLEDSISDLTFVGVLPGSQSKSVAVPERKVVVVSKTSKR